MIISVPWPHPDLSPNARKNRFALARRRKAYRTGCAWEAVSAGAKKLTADYLHVTITFYPPDRRHRDRDNMIAALKSGQDGIADAIGVDDSRWVPTYAVGEPVARGRVVFDFGGVQG